MISPMYSSGVVTSTLNTGSNITGLAFVAACLSAIDPAILNAISDESTSWYDPSYRVTFTSTKGYPAITPDSRASLHPFSTAGIYSLGITPPVILLTNSNSLPGFGSSIILTCPYCPLPPDCFAYLTS